MNCKAIAKSTSSQCRNRAKDDGFCTVHGRMHRDRKQLTVVTAEPKAVEPRNPRAGQPRSRREFRAAVDLGGADPLNISGLSQRAAQLAQLSTGAFDTLSISKSLNRFTNDFLRPEMFGHASGIGGFGNSLALDFGALEHVSAYTSGLKDTFAALDSQHEAANELARRLTDEIKHVKPHLELVEPMPNGILDAVKASQDFAREHRAMLDSSVAAFSSEWARAQQSTFDALGDFANEPNLAVKSVLEAASSLAAGRDRAFSHLRLEQSEALSGVSHLLKSFRSDVLDSFRAQTSASSALAGVLTGFEGVSRSKSSLFASIDRAARAARGFAPDSLSLLLAPTSGLESAMGMLSAGQLGDLNSPISRHVDSLNKLAADAVAWRERTFGDLNLFQGFATELAASASSSLETTLAAAVGLADPLHLSSLFDKIQASSEYLGSLAGTGVLDSIRDFPDELLDDIDEILGGTELTTVTGQTSLVSAKNLKVFFAKWVVPALVIFCLNGGLESTSIEAVVHHLAKIFANMWVVGQIRKLFGLGDNSNDR